MDAGRYDDTQDLLGVRERLAAIASALGDDEVKVLVRIGRRLQHGAGQYGALAVATDTRNFRGEAREEIEDALVYFACAWLKREVAQ